MVSSVYLFGKVWLRGQDLNLRPSGYEPDELPGCSTPRKAEDRGQRTEGRRKGVLRLWSGAFVLAWEGFMRPGPPPVAFRLLSSDFCLLSSVLVWTWRRPTLPRLEAQYHGRCGVSRPSSEWDRVGHPRCSHQVEAGTEGRRRRAEGRRRVMRGWAGMGRPGGTAWDDGSGGEDPSVLCLLPSALCAALPRRHAPCAEAGGDRSSD